jgi:branched-chain amino acid transport system substrate-binding protein
MPRSQRPRFLRLLALLAVFGLLAAACGDDDDATTSDTTADDGTDTTAGGGGTGEGLKIAFVGPLTGDAANLGINIRDGIKVALDEAGSQVELVEFDTQGDPAQATTLKDDFVNDDSVIAIIGPTFSGETRALLPSLEEAGLVMVSASATNVELPTVVPDQKVFHRLIPDDGVQGEGLTGYITDNLKAKKVAYVHDNSDYGKGLSDGTQALVEKAGVATAVVEAVDPKSQDFSAAVNSVKAAAPDLIFYGGYYAEAGRLRKQLVDAGVTAKFLTGDGALDPGFIESAGAGGDGAQITCPCNLATEDSADADLAAFATAYRALIGKAPGTYSTEGYDAANLLLAGIEAGNEDRAGMLEYVEGLTSFDGISKQIEFEDNGNIKATDVFIFEVKSGKITLLGKTSELS